MVSETDSKLNLEYLKWPRFLMKSAAIWIVEKDTPFLKTARTIYWYFLLVTCGYFCGSFVFGLKDLLHVDDMAMTLMQHCEFMIYYLLILWKMVLCRTKPMRRIIDKINNYEHWVRQQDESVIRIFEDNCRYNKKIFIIIILILVALVVSYTVSSAFDMMTWEHEDYVWPKNYRLLEWFPFNVLKNMKKAYIYQIVNANFTITYGMVCDVFFLALINFPVTQLRVLGHQFEQFQEYCKKGEKDPVAVLRNLKEQHEDIIRFIDEVNEVCKWLFFGDFCLKSYHLSTVLFQLKRMHEVDGLFVFTMSCVATLYSQVAINYYHANDIILESNNLGTRIYMSAWYDEPSEIKQRLYIIMMRSQRPLMLVIANLDFMSIVLLMKIFKACYTYWIMANNI